MFAKSKLSGKLNFFCVQVVMVHTTYDTAEESTIARALLGDFKIWPLTSVLANICANI